ncbi:MAG TPA: hypothetical protein VF054_02965 [Micromonosporaceae bacterium]
MSLVPTAPAPHDEVLPARQVAEVLRLLYPEPCEVSSELAGDVVADYVLVPNTRRPRLLVPANSARVASAAVRRYAEVRTRTGRFKRGAAAAALRTGASHMLMRDRIRIVAPPADDGQPVDTVDRYLRRSLGRPVSLAVHIGPARTRRTPVLHVLAQNGDTLGYAKLGSGELTRRLVRTETVALTALSRVPLRGVTVPGVVHTGVWRGNTVLVQSGLPVDRPHVPLSRDRLTDAMREVSRCLGTTVAPVAASEYWSGLRARLAEVGDHPDGRTLGMAADLLVAARGDTRLTFGSWHGDWTPWNMIALDDTLLVWDWERFASAVPLGFDALHHDLQVRLTTVDANEAVEVSLARAAEALRPFGVPADAADLTATLHLIELAARYLADRQSPEAGQLGLLGTWLLPVLLRRVEVLCG